MPATSHKIQKILAARGVGSRRAIEVWIAAGRIHVDGQLATIGQRVNENALISMDGIPIPPPLSVHPSSDATEVIMYHKPRGEICSRRDPEGRPTVFDHLPEPLSGRWIVVGRLDANTSGLLLFTNNGELAHQLMHPKFHIEREYKVRVFGEVSSDICARLTEGVQLSDGLAKFNKLIPLKGEGRNHWFRVVLNIGRNRIVRRLWESQGIKVNRLERIRFGDLSLPDSLKAGRVQKTLASVIVSD